ncbi:MAG: hypothetical protein IPK16_33630 [Anaerolineales bacterium]|nr:hypothetical protein [Anaerolineales bacterium]
MRWTAPFDLNGGKYRFSARADDGVRIYVDGRRILDKWGSHNDERHSVQVDLGKGIHTVVVEYQELTGWSIIKVSVDQIIPGQAPIGNIITCVPPQPQNYAWIKLYRLDGNNHWYPIARGIGSIEPSGYLKIDGLPVDIGRFGNNGEPYKVEQWIDGKIARSTGDFQRGEPEFRVRSFTDNYTPWGCGR